MIIHITAPDSPIDTTLPKVFLAGSIEMGKAVNWQDYFVDTLAERSNCLVLNPRRDAWDLSWAQSIDNPVFKEQVTWEHDMIMASDLVVFYFQPETMSPITLMELGLVAGKGIPAIVACPDGFWRKGNVEYICKTYNIPLVNSLDQLIEVTASTLSS